MPSQSKSILVVTGETSGENHAAGLIRRLEVHNPQWHLEWFGSGGPQMASAGVELLTDVSQLAAIGPWEALSHMGRYWKLYRRILEESRKRQPQLALLVDFPEFNLILARRLKQMKIPICYFIGPQVWAWRPRRVHQIRRFVDLMLVIFPFEEEFYRRQG
ncbi:lipid-A-disaccharide synthase, partial [bacterium]|nr:lipid-A-disaccharide synthase [bacterium]